MKVFFEEYGMVLVVTVIVAGMLIVSNTFSGTMQEIVDEKWQEITDGGN